MNLQSPQNRAKLIPFLLVYISLFVFGTTAFATDCDNLDVSSTNSSITISSLTAPIEIIKVYDAAWKKIYECSADCQDEITIENLEPNDYHVELQAFNGDWEKRCERTVDITVGTCICPAIYMPVCGVDGNTYSNACEAACVGVEVAAEGECTTVTTCDLLARITFNPDLCSQCLSEIAVYSLDEKSYLVFLADNLICSDGLTTVLDCDTGEELCKEGGIAGFSCGNFFEDAQKIETVLKDDCSPCVCPLNYDPVCGVDGKTYGNACEAACAGVEIAAEGACPCLCPAVALPVCGVDGKTYINECEAACAGVAVAFEGTCEECIGEPKPDIICTTEIAPVCGCNGITYNNACEAEAAGIKSWTEGICPDPNDCIGTPLPDIACIQVYEPVCGCDGVTYGNDCMAQQAGIREWTEGPCPCACPENYDPVCGVDGKTYGNACEAECAGVEVAKEGECATNTCLDGNCDLLNRILLNPDLCESCLTEIATYCYEGEIYLVFFGDNFFCADAPTTVLSCRTGEEFCSSGGLLGETCGDFFNKAIKLETILRENCEDDCKGLPTPGVPCPEIYAPVCGCDGNTYDNDCMAQSLGIKKWTVGKCEDLKFIECGEISIAYGNSRIKMTGTGNQYFFKVHDLTDNWAEVFDCSADCGNEQIATLPDGKYMVKIYNTDWKNVCEQEIIVGDATTTEEPPVIGAGSFECGDATITYGDGMVLLEGATDKKYHLKIIDERFKDAFACMWECGSVIEARNLMGGKYIVRVFDADYRRLCEKTITLANEAADRNNPNIVFTTFPNPAKDVLYIQLGEYAFEKGQIQILNTYGQIIHKQPFDNQSTILKVDVQSYQNGLYYYQLELPNQPLVTKKFIVNRLY